MRKRPRYDKTKAVKAMARKRVGSPRPGRVLDEKPVRAKPKHKTDWLEQAEPNAEGLDFKRSPERK